MALSHRSGVRLRPSRWGSSPSMRRISRIWAETDGPCGCITFTKASFFKTDRPPDRTHYGQFPKCENAPNAAQDSSVLVGYPGRERRGSLLWVQHSRTPASPDSDSYIQSARERAHEPNCRAMLGL